MSPHTLAQDAIHALLCGVPICMYEIKFGSFVNLSHADLFIRPAGRT